MLLTTAEAAKLLGITPGALRKRAERMPWKAGPPTYRREAEIELVRPVRRARGQNLGRHWVWTVEI
jgi:hypothetical protein